MFLKEAKNYNINILDSLRAFAALSVCLFHFICTTTGYVQTAWILDIFSIGKYGVQLFFVISGFVIPWAMYSAGFKFSDFPKFLLKRLARLEPPYVFSIIFALIILFCRDVFFGIQNTHVIISTKQVILHFGYLIPFFENYQWLNEVYWTLAIEFQYYFFIALLFIPLINSNLLLRIFAGLAITTLSFTTTPAFLPYWLPVFYLGIITFLFKAEFIKVTEFFVSLFIILSFCLYKYPIPSVLYMLLPVISILFFSKYKFIFFNFFGKMSYSIYLIHPLVGASLINILSHHFTSNSEKVIIILAGIILTLISSYIMYFIIERPSKRLSASIKYNARLFARFKFTK